MRKCVCLEFKSCTAPPSTANVFTSSYLVAVWGGMEWRVRVDPKPVSRNNANLSDTLDTLNVARAMGWLKFVGLWPRGFESHPGSRDVFPLGTWCLGVTRSLGGPWPVTRVTWRSRCWWKRVHFQFVFDLHLQSGTTSKAQRLLVNSG